MFKKCDVLKALQHHIGHENGLRCDVLVCEITADAQANAAEKRHLRKLVNELRMEGHHICAHPHTGYFIAANENELNNTCDFLYERAMASLAQVSRMKNVSIPDLRGQLRLPN